jgi:branched-chain amino acid transport system substrate-binding protein
MKNRMVKGKRLGIILAAGLAALLLLAACAPAPTVPAEEEKVVEIGMLVSLTGAVAEANQLWLLTWEDGLRYWGETEGIPGVTIRYVWTDCARDTARMLSTYRSFIHREVAAITIVTPPGMFKAMAEKDEVPILVGSITGDTMYPPGWAYSYIPTEAERFAVVADWIMANWREERPPRIAFVVPDVEYAHDAMNPSKQYAESIGMEWLPPEFVPYVVLDSTVQLLRLSEAGADFAYVGPEWGISRAVLRDAERLGLMDKISFCGMAATLTRSVVDIVGPSLEGYFTPKACPVWNEVENPGIKWAQDVYLMYHGTKEIPDSYELSIRPCPILLEAIKRAIEKVGYENLDGRAVNEALQTLEDFDPYGFGVPVTYTDPEVRRGSPWARIYQVQGGDVIPVSDWQEAPIMPPVE